MKKSNFFLTVFFFLTFYLLLQPFGNAQYSKLFDFADTANGINPYGSLISDGTFLYGMTARGGLNSNGVIFKIKPDGTAYSKLREFADTVNGMNPNGSLIYDGTFLYGMTSDGGTMNRGVIFKIKPDGSSFTKLLDFTGSANGIAPLGSLISDGTFLYGMTLGGGTGASCAGGCGTIFKIKPDGSGYSKLLDFLGSANGSMPFGSLFTDGAFLYGMTTAGGTNNGGVLFKIMPDGSGYSKLLDFTGTANGYGPWESLISDGTFLYGMTAQGGTNNGGVLFKIMPDGTGYSKLLDFTGAANGKNPTGSLVFDGIFLYGMTLSGGINGIGVIFKIKPDGTDYSTLLDFAGTNGKNPNGSLISDGTFLYGMTPHGGINSLGTIFKYALATSVSKIKNVESQISVSPNPFTDKIKISSPHIINSITICNVFGQPIFQSPSSNLQSVIDLSSYPNGIYFLTALINNKPPLVPIHRETLKLIKM